MCSKGCGKMGNYYEGVLVFGLKKDIPEDLLHDLSLLTKDCDEENFLDKLLYKELKESKWTNHYRPLYPTYYLEFYKSPTDEYTGWYFSINFCMKGYMYDGDDLGQDIYDFLQPYIDETAYNMANGGYVGKVEDEDGTYRKEFYVDYEQFNKIIESREYLCKGCYKKMDGSLCNDWKYCKRAYDIGRGDTIEDS